MANICRMASAFLMIATLVSRNLCSRKKNPTTSAMQGASACLATGTQTCTQFIEHRCGGPTHSHGTSRWHGQYWETKATRDMKRGQHGGGRGGKGGEAREGERAWAKQSAVSVFSVAGTLYCTTLLLISSDSRIDGWLAGTCRQQPGPPSSDWSSSML